MTAWMSNAMKRKMARADGVQALCDWIGGRAPADNIQQTIDISSRQLERARRRYQDAIECLSPGLTEKTHGRRR